MIAVVEICYIDEFSQQQVRYFADRAFVTLPTATPPNTVVEGRLKETARVSWRVGTVLWGDEDSSISVESVQLLNHDGALDHWFAPGKTFRDCAIHQHLVPDELSNMDQSTRVASAIIDRLEFREAFVEIATIERAALLEQPIQADLYDGSQPNQDLTGLAKPIAIGECLNVRPVPIDGNNLVYQCNSSLLTDIGIISDRGDPLSAADYAKDETAGTLTLNNNPQGLITAHVTGSPRGQAPANPGDILGGIGDFESWDSSEPLGWDFVQFDGQGVLSNASGAARIIDTSDTSQQNALITESSSFVVPGIKYRYTFDLKIHSGQVSVFVRIGGVDGPFHTTDGTHTGEVVAGPTGKVRIATQRPAAPVPWDIELDNFVVEEVIDQSVQSLPEFIKHIVHSYASIPMAEIDVTEAQAIDTPFRLARYIHPESVPQVREVLQEVVDSVGGFYYEQAGVFHVDQLRPAGNTPELEIHLDELAEGITIEQDTAPGLTTRIGVDRNWQPHEPGSIAGVVDEQAAQQLSQQFLRVIEASDIELLDPIYHHAKNAPLRPTLLRDFDEAPQDQIDQEIGLYAQPRYFYFLRGYLGKIPSTLKPMSTVRVTGNRLGLEHGTDLALVGIDPQRLSDGKADLILWGTAGRYRTHARGPFSATNYYRLNSVSLGADSKQFFFAASIYVLDGPTTEQRIFSSNNGRFEISTFGQILRFVAKNDAGTEVLHVQADKFLSKGCWNHIICSCDMANGMQLFINRRQDKLRDDVVFTPTFVDSPIDFSTNNHLGIGAKPIASPSDPADRLYLSHLAFEPGIAPDLTDAFRSRIFDKYGRPVDGGPGGIDALGQVAAIWCPDGDASRNEGGLGPFTDQGAVSTPDVSPTDDVVLPCVQPSSGFNFPPTYKSYITSARGEFSSANYYRLNTSLTGVTDGKQGVFVIWFFLDTAAGAQRIFRFGGDRGLVQCQSGDLRIILKSPTGAVIADLLEPDILDQQFRNALIVAWDTAAGTFLVYLNDRPIDTSHIIVPDEVIDYTVGSNSIGAAWDGTAPMSGGAVSHIGLFTEGFFDINQVATRRRFFDKYHRPVFGGPDGSRAFGQQPAIWIPDGNASNNRGYGGDFDEVGTVPLADDYPTDFQ